MTQKRIQIIISLMSLTLIGIVWVQWFWIAKTIEAGRQQFEQDVYTTLRQTTEKLEKHDMFQFITKNYENNN